MIAKLFEILDVGTFVPALAVNMSPRHEREHYLLRRSGFGPEDFYVTLVKIDGGHGEANCDPFAWGDRTMTTAHKYIRKNFDELESGAVVDVEHILGETETPKPSEFDEHAHAFDEYAEALLSLAMYKGAQ